MNTVKKMELDLSQFFQIRINSLSPNAPLPCDVYLPFQDRVVLIRKKGDRLTADRLKQLSTHGVQNLFVPTEQREIYLDGLTNGIHDPDNDPEAKARFIKETAFIHIHDLFTKDDISQAVNNSKNLVEDMMNFISSDITAATNLMRLSKHDYYTYNHSVDVAVYAIVLARKIFGDKKDIIMAAGLGGFLHDIGKRKIDWGLINKPGALTKEEWTEIKKHPSYGKELIESMPNIPTDIKHVVYQHHENFDGKGYPNALRGDEINVLARVVTIADVFDALTTNRSYHHAIAPKDALDTMFTMQPGKFDPSLFGSFNKNFEKKTTHELPQNFDPCAPQKIRTK